MYTESLYRHKVFPFRRMYALPRFLYLPLERNIKHMDMPHFTFSLPIAKCHGLATRPPTLPPTPPASWVECNYS